ncbi:hypothetical protein KIW84_041099 [Lathyrus oleraceus]|uniref:Aminotransferase-like plant mobile domain-containing protein n=1 Tax=Pisum sativum TaxID=3888 RepID=A0A9D4X931_PEA|nr:hypothetical protein KIW84_041099 [Pisum sativum]
MSHVIAFIPLRENHATEPYRIYLGCLVVVYMHFNNYVDDIRPFDGIMIYSIWLACGLHLTAPHLLERVMRRFDYTQTILRHLVVSASLVLTRRQMNDMLDDYESHLVSEEARGTIAESDWSYVEGYIRWFFRVS